MNESPVSTLEQKRNRRGLLALIGAGGAAAVAALLSRGNGAEAHGTLHRDSSSPTAPALHGHNNSSATGAPGVEGSSSNGWGVFGRTSNGIGVYGTGRIGVFGTAPKGTGQKGDIGVRGFVGYGTGVSGESSLGPGISGVGMTGVSGRANTAGGAGVYGNAGSGAVGVRADGGHGKTALLVRGHARFRESGKTTVSAGAYSRVVPLTFTLAPGSLIVATLQGNAGRGVTVRTASKYGWNKIRITLTKAATKSATIAYFIFTP